MNFWRSSPEKEDGKEFRLERRVEIVLFMVETGVTVLWITDSSSTPAMSVVVTERSLEGSYLVLISGDQVQHVGHDVVIKIRRPRV